MSYYLEPFPFSDGGGPSSGSAAVEKVTVIVVHAGFGDCTLLEVLHDDGEKSHYLIDGGPTHHPGGGRRVMFLENLIETLLSTAPRDSDTFKLDGIMVTHPDGDHMEGVKELFERFPPNENNPNQGVKFAFKGPLLFTKAFWQDRRSSEFIRKTLRKAKFAGIEAEQDEPISGFEKVFRFFYPGKPKPKAKKKNLRATGVVYNYIDPPPTPFPLPRGVPEGTFEPNASSTLMLVNDPKGPVGNPIISLNGDALGASILNVIQDRPLKIFKVSHHGSKNNSLPLDTIRSSDYLNTCKLFATQALLEVLTPPEPKQPLPHRPFPRVLIGGSVKRFEKDYTPSEIYQKRISKQPLVLGDCLHDLAVKFSNELTNGGYNTDQLLKRLQKRMQQIIKNIQDTEVQPWDFYTRDLDHLPMYTAKVYSDVKSAILAAQELEDKEYRKQLLSYAATTGRDRPTEGQLPYKVSKAYRKIFTYLERDSIFHDQLYVRFTTKFYDHVSAETYFISSGAKHGHPHIPVVNGIINAATTRHDADGTYKCRLLLTSGNGIIETLLPDYPNCTWKSFVSIQYFRGDTASVSIDSSSAPDTVLAGTAEWTGPGEVRSRPLIKEYSSTQGARALQRKRSTLETQRGYEITANGFWLCVTNQGNEGVLRLSASREETTVKTVLVSNQIRENLFIMSLESVGTQSRSIAFVNGYTGYYMPGGPVGFTLFMYAQVDQKGPWKVMFLVDDGGTLAYSEERNNATRFVFTRADAVTAVPHTVSPFLSQPATSFSMPYSFKVSALKTAEEDGEGIGKAKATRDTPDRTVKTDTLSLLQYLQSVDFTGDPSTLNGKTLLDLLLTEQVVSQLTSSTKISHDSPVYKFTQTMLQWPVFAAPTFQASETGVVSGNFELKLPLPLPTLNGNTVHAVSLAIRTPKTENLKLSMDLEQTDVDGFPSTQAYHLEWLIQSFPQSFDSFLQAIEVTPPVPGFNVFDAVILFFQSESAGYFVLDSFPKVLVSRIIDYQISKELTSIAFACTPTGVILSERGAELVPVIPEADSSFDIGLSHAVTIKKLVIHIPPHNETSMSTRISAAVVSGNQQLQISASMMPDGLPSMEFKWSGSLSLSDVLSFLQLDSGVKSLHVPILASALDDIHITEAGFSISQAVSESNTTLLSSVFFGVEFTNLSSYLPAAFSSLKQASAYAIVYSPSDTSARRTGFKVAFTFMAQQHKDDPEVAYSASLSAMPVLGTSESKPSYNFEVSINTAATEGLSLHSALSAFGLDSALSSVMGVPILKNLLTNIHLKELTLALNTQSKAIQGFSLHLLIPNWDLIPGKVSVTMFDLYMNYSQQVWAAAFEATAVFADTHPVAIKLKIPVSSEVAVLEFENTDLDFTMATFLEVFGLGSIKGIPIIGTLLQISIVDAYLSIVKTTDTAATSVGEGRVSLYVDTLAIGSLFTLNQVSLEVSFTENPATTQSYNFSFHVAGFINRDKVYLDVGYDADDSILSGQALISSFKEADLSFVAKTFLSSGSGYLETNDAYKMVSSNITAGIMVALKLGEDITLQYLLVQVKGKLPLIRSLYLASLRFIYHLQEPSDKSSPEPPAESDGLFPPGTSLNLVAALSSDESQFHAQIEFDLTTSTDGSILTASLSPPCDESSIELRSFLSLLGVTTPEIPTVGQNNPNFLNLGLTSGSVKFSLSPFALVEFDIQVQTSESLRLLSSPTIQLEKLCLRVSCKAVSSSAPKASLLGIVSLAGMEIWLEGKNDENGLVFSVTTFFGSTGSGDFQGVIDQLAPSDSATPTLPTGVNLPLPIEVGVTQLTISLLNSSRSLDFRGATEKLDWTIRLGFQDFTVKQLGGLVEFMEKLTDETTTSFTAFLTGQFQYSSISMDSKLHFGSSIDTVLDVLVRDANDIKLVSLADDVLGFNRETPPAPLNNEATPPREGDSDAASFDKLLPSSVDLQGMEYSSAFMNLNLSKSQFLIAGQLMSVGTGFFIAGKFAAKFGYAFGISLPNGFLFSHLLRGLDFIDDILRVRKANVAVLSLDDVKVSDLVTSMKEAQSSFRGSTELLSLPFTNLTLDDATNKKTVGKGMSFYAEIDFGSIGEDSVFKNILQIGDPSLHTGNASARSQPPDVVLSAQIEPDPTMTRFEAYIEKLVLLGLLEFRNISLVYEPSNQNTLNLKGKITILLGTVGYSFRGTLISTNTEADFIVVNDPAERPTIAEPFGMFGISLAKSLLSLHYEFHKDKPNSILYEISGMVHFFSKEILPSPGSDSSPSPTPTISLTGTVFFKGTDPQVVIVTLDVVKPLTVSDFVSTVFNWNYGTEYLNFGFTKGSVYYANLPEGEKIEVDGHPFLSGYHISADVEIFSHLFNITADILEAEMTITGSAYKTIDLGFAEFTGVKDSQPDQSRSPELSFTKSSSATIISLNVGLVLFESPLAVASIGYDVKSKSFLGSLTYSGDIEFFRGATMSFQWNEKGGFRVDEWYPISDALPFDFFKMLTNYEVGCGNLVGLLMDEAWKTKFEVNVKLSPTQKPSEFIADIDISGTYDILVAGQTKIASIPLPDLRVGIPKIEAFTLKKLPKFILELFTKNAQSIVGQLVNDPEKLAQILGIVALKSVSSKIMEVFVCRNVQTPHVESAIGDKNVTDKKFKEANKKGKTARDSIKKMNESIGKRLLGSAAKFAAGAIGEANGAMGIFSGIAAGLGSILGVFGIGNYYKKKKEAEERKEALRKETEAARKTIVDALDIGTAPKAVFTPPDTINVHWKAIDYKGAHYHVKTTGRVMTSSDSDTTEAVTIDRDTVSSIAAIRDERLYHAVSITATVWGTITASDLGHTSTFDGKRYSVEVANVQPTLKPPTRVTAAFNSDTLQIAATASTVPLAHTYIFQLGGGIESFEMVAEGTVTPSNDAGLVVEFSFPYSRIPTGAMGPFRVRCNVVAMHVLLGSSEFAYSDSLQLAPPISHLVVTPSHFSTEPADSVRLTWTLPTSTAEISGLLCQALHTESKVVLLSEILSRDEQAFPTSYQIPLQDILQSLIDHKFLDLKSGPSPSVTLDFRLSCVGKSSLVISSVFCKCTLKSLQSPPTVSFSFSAERKMLQILWEHIQKTNNYGVLILDNKDTTVWSKLVSVSDDAETEGKFGHSINERDLAAVADPDIQYKVRVLSVASSDAELDSLFATEAQQKLQVHNPPTGTALEFSNSDNEIIVRFRTDQDVATYSITLVGTRGQVLAKTGIPSPTGDIPEELKANVRINAFIQSLKGGDTVNASLQSLGGGKFLSSRTSDIQDATLNVLHQPSHLTYSYSPEANSITLKCNTVSSKVDYALGLTDPMGQADDIMCLAKATEDSPTAVISPDLLRSSGVMLWKAFARTVGSSTHISSPLTHLTTDIQVLPKPIVLSFEYTDLSNLCASCAPVPNSSGYKVHLQVISPESSVMYELTRIVQSTDQTTPVTVTVDATSEIPDWPSVLEQLQSVTLTVTSCGAGYFITSLPGPSSLERFSAPKQLQYLYSPEQNLITLSCNTVKGVSSYYLGIADDDEGLTVFNTVMSSDTAATVSVTFLGSALPIFRDGSTPLIRNIIAGTVWKVFAQSLGNTTHFSSSKTVAHVLHKPEIESATYDWVSKDFATTWTSIDHTSHYEIEISAMRGDGVVLTMVEKVEPTDTPTETLTMNMGTDLHGWNVFFFLVQLSSITVVVRAIGSELYLSGSSSEPCIIPESRISSPANVKVQASERVVTVTWACVSDAISYNVDIFLDGVPVDRDEVPGNDTMYKVHDSLLIEKVSFPYKHHIKASVSALSSSPSHPSLPAEAETDMVFEFNGSLSEEWGSPIGQRFDDVASRSTDIVGIKFFLICHGKSIDSLQAEYRLEDGSSFVADKHGGMGGFESYIEFSDGEVITEIHGSANGDGVHHLMFVTTVTDGARKEFYGPYGTTGSKTFSIKSKIIGFYGKCGDTLDAIGFYCR